MAQTVPVDIINNYPDWMSKAYSSLEHKRLCDLPLPGSHDAGAYGDIRTRSQAQGLSIYRQLLAGFRYFDFRVCVDNGAFYAVHGGDSTSNYYCAISSKRSEHGPYIFDDIKRFCIQYPKELVVMHFSHFVGAGGQNFNPTDEGNFADLIREYFGPMLIGETSQIQTYGPCVSSGQRVVAIVDADSTWPDLSMLWSAERCFLDRYSNKYFDMSGGIAFNNLQAKVDYTLDDQEDYLMTGGDGHRDPNKFWVTQAVLNYAAVPHDGHSQNYYGAKELNPQFIAAYKNWRQGKLRNGNPNSRMQKPNVLLMDYAGYFLGGPANDPLGLF